MLGPVGLQPYLSSRYPSLSFLPAPFAASSTHTPNIFSQAANPHLAQRYHPKQLSLTSQGVGISCCRNRTSSWHPVVHSSTTKSLVRSLVTKRNTIPLSTERRTGTGGHRSLETKRRDMGMGPLCIQTSGMTIAAGLEL